MAFNPLSLFGPARWAIGVYRRYRQARRQVTVLVHDSDLRFPIEEARRRVPVGTVNPSPNRLAGDLKGDPTGGAGRHWWRQLASGDLVAHQLPDPAGGFHRPPW